MSWVLAFVGFAALIILHEFGHFAAAKAVGMRVEKFSLFFGPMPLKWRRGETVYGVGVIPLGGYVKITGMNPLEELEPEVAPRAYYAQPPWKRIVVILAGPAMNLLIAFVLLVGIFTINGIGHTSRTVGDVERGSPAAAHLQKGDRILAVDGRPGTLQNYSDRINSHGCARGAKVKGCTSLTPTTVTVERAGERRTFTFHPRYDPAARRHRVGFAYATHFVTDGPVRAARRSVSTMWQVTTGTVSTVGKVFFSAKDRKQVHGIVGSYETTRQSFTFSTAEALFVLALISLSLAIVNLFPFLPLDGGHVFWAVAEKVRGRAIPFSVMERSGAVGFMLIAILFFIGLTNDIGRLDGQGFGIR